jgi:hypothetical protein
VVSRRVSGVEHSVHQLKRPATHGTAKLAGPDRSTFHLIGEEHEKAFVVRIGAAQVVGEFYEHERREL